jgi:pyridoxamine 5'-phosphate oxidase
MIEFNNLSQEKPYIKLKKKYDDAEQANQQNIEAVSISSYSTASKEVNSRYVNLKFVEGKELIFFSNYNSLKSKDFHGHNQITALLYWNKVSTQIRMKALIKKTSEDFNKNYFLNRSVQKNAVAISSRQSEPIDSFERVKENYNKSLKLDSLKKCPDYWGGYSFVPYYFEFWEGSDLRLNKRDIYKKNNGVWLHAILQP